MTDTNQPPALPPPSPTPAPPPEPEDDGFNVLRVVYISMGAFAGIVLLIFVLAILGAVFSTATFGSVIQIIRDIMIIFLVLEGTLIILALVILIAQVARLVNLLQNEVKPILKNTQETMQHARGTVEFVGKNLTEPVVKANAFVAATGVFLSEVFRLRRAVTPDKTSPED